MFVDLEDADTSGDDEDYKKDEKKPDDGKYEKRKPKITPPSISSSDSLVYIEDCQQAILELQAKLDACGPKDMKKWESMKKSLKWPLSASETREMSMRIERLKSTIQIGLEADSL